ncbi:MAG: PilZ domain-containing protein [Acetivibrionales bacterium]
MYRNVYKNAKLVFIPKGNNNFFNGSVVEFNDSFLVAGCRIHKDEILDRKASIFIYNTLKGEIEYEGEISGYSKNVVVFQNLKHIKNIQRRYETRVEIDLELQVKRIIAAGNKVINLPKKIFVQSINLSASGILFFCKLNIIGRIRVCFELPIDNDTIFCTAEIIRKEIKENGYYYGCRFIDLSENEQDRIRGYVYKMQIAKRKN